jgi:hypothetical protein
MSNYPYYSSSPYAPTYGTSTPQDRTAQYTQAETQRYYNNNNRPRTPETPSRNSAGAANMLAPERSSPPPNNQAGFHAWAQRGGIATPTAQDPTYRPYGYTPSSTSPQQRAPAVYSPVTPSSSQVCYSTPLRNQDTPQSLSYTAMYGTPSVAYGNAHAYVSATQQSSHYGSATQQNTPYGSATQQNTYYGSPTQQNSWYGSPTQH